jgi:hypothetical protein
MLMIVAGASFCVAARGASYYTSFCLSEQAVSVTASAAAATVRRRTVDLVK